jgi:AcrR family transcriptional regulator
MSAVQRRSAEESENDTRQALLDAATRIIEGDGPTAATSRAITDGAGANLGAVTYYFGSKDALVAEALANAGRRLLAPVVGALTDTGSPVEQMVRATQILPEILRTQPRALRGYVQALAAAVHDPSVREALGVLHRDITDELAAQMHSHQAEGIIPEWVDPLAMAAVIVSLVDGVAVTAAAELTEVDPATIGAQFAAVLLHASIAGQKSD